MKTTPHKYADVIKAWADGIAIQYKYVLGTWDDLVNSAWNVPAFSSVHHEWRIKPVYPTLAEIASTAWYSNWSEDPATTTWKAAAVAVKAAIESGEFSE